MEGGKGRGRSRFAEVGASRRDFFKEYEMMVLLGNGSFGEVWVCRERATGRSFACKLMEKSSGSAGSGASASSKRRGEAGGGRWAGRQQQQEEEDDDEESKTMDMLREIAILRMFQGKHKNVVQLHEVLEGELTVQVVMELCRGGDLFDLLCKHDKLPEPAARVIFAQLASAMGHMHAEGVLHRDIKPENILFDRPAAALYKYTDPRAPPPAVQAKLADFGLSLILGTFGSASGFCGSRFYTAPEMVRGRSYSFPADVWSMGVVLAVMLTARLPFAGDTSEDHDGLRKAILKGKVGFHQQEWDGVSREAMDLVQWMLEVNPEKRPCAADVLAHPWFTMHVPLLTADAVPALSPEALYVEVPMPSRAVDMNAKAESRERHSAVEQLADGAPADDLMERPGDIDMDTDGGPRESLDLPRLTSDDKSAMWGSKDGSRKLSELNAELSPEAGSVGEGASPSDRLTGSPDVFSHTPLTTTARYGDVEANVLDGTASGTTGAVRRENGAAEFGGTRGPVVSHGERASRLMESEIFAEEMEELTGTRELQMGGHVSHVTPDSTSGSKGHREYGAKPEEGSSTPPSIVKALVMKFEQMNGPEGSDGHRHMKPKVVPTKSTESPQSMHSLATDPSPCASESSQKQGGYSTPNTTGWGNSRVSSPDDMGAQGQGARATFLDPLSPVLQGGDQARGQGIRSFLEPGSPVLEEGDQARERQFQSQTSAPQKLSWYIDGPPLTDNEEGEWQKGRQAAVVHSVVSLRSEHKQAVIDSAGAGQPQAAAAAADAATGAGAGRETAPARVPWFASLVPLQSKLHVSPSLSCVELRRVVTQTVSAESSGSEGALAAGAVPRSFTCSELSAGNPVLKRVKSQLLDTNPDSHGETRTVLAAPAGGDRSAANADSLNPRQPVKARNATSRARASAAEPSVASSQRKGMAAGASPKPAAITGASPKPPPDLKVPGDAYDLRRSVQWLNQALLRSPLRRHHHRADAHKPDTTVDDVPPMSPLPSQSKPHGEGALPSRGIAPEDDERKPDAPPASPYNAAKLDGSKKDARPVQPATAGPPVGRGRSGVWRELWRGPGQVLGDEVRETQSWRAPPATTAKGSSSNKKPGAQKLESAKSEKGSSTAAAQVGPTKDPAPFSQSKFPGLQNKKPAVHFSRVVSLQQTAKAPPALAADPREGWWPGDKKRSKGIQGIYILDEKGEFSSVAIFTKETLTSAIPAVTGSKPSTAAATTAAGPENLAEQEDRGSHHRPGTAGMKRTVSSIFPKVRNPVDKGEAGGAQGKGALLGRSSSTKAKAMTRAAKQGAGEAEAMPARPKSSAGARSSKGVAARQGLGEAQGVGAARPKTSSGVRGSKGMKGRTLTTSESSKAEAPWGEQTPDVPSSPLASGPRDGPKREKKREKSLGLWKGQGKHQETAASRDGGGSGFESRLQRAAPDARVEEPRASIAGPSPEANRVGAGAGAQSLTPASSTKRKANKSKKASKAEQEHNVVPDGSKVDQPGVAAQHAIARALDVRNGRVVEDSPAGLTEAGEAGAASSQAGSQPGNEPARYQSEGEVKAGRRSSGGEGQEQMRRKRALKKAKKPMPNSAEGGADPGQTPGLTGNDSKVGDSKDNGDVGGTPGTPPRMEGSAKPQVGKGSGKARAEMEQLSAEPSGKEVLGAHSRSPLRSPRPSTASSMSGSDLPVPGGAKQQKPGRRFWSGDFGIVRKAKTGSNGAKAGVLDAAGAGHMGVTQSAEQLRRPNTASAARGRHGLYVAEGWMDKGGKVARSDAEAAVSQRALQKNRTSNNYRSKKPVTDRTRAQLSRVATLSASTFAGDPVNRPQTAPVYG